MGTRPGSLRHAFDITPWDQKGYSFLGMRRPAAKRLGLAFLFLGAMFADPPGGLLPNDFINLYVADKLFAFFNTWTYVTWLALTYTLIAWGLIFLGAWIYPYHTKSLLNGYLARFQNLLRKVSRNPLYLLASIAGFIFMFHIYKNVLLGVLP